MKRRMELCLTLFDGGAAGGGAAGGASGGATGGAAAGTAMGAEGTAGAAGAAEGAAGAVTETGEQENAEPAKELTPAERRAAYEQLIKGDYKDLYGEDVQKAINRRYAENQTLHDQLDSYRPLLEMLSTKYGTGSDKVEDIMAAIDNDTTFFEEQAMKEGMSVERYKEFMRMKAKTQSMEEAHKRAQSIRQKEETYARWDQEAQICAKQFPGFNIETEISSNPNFVRLLGAGCDVTTAYKATHFDDITQNLIVEAAKDTKKQVADSIRAGAGRPVEAAGNGQPGKTTVDISKMSSQEFRKFREDLMAGRVSLS